MKVLFTGGSSFTGFWFIRELAAAGHDVTAVFRKRPDEYSENGSTSSCSCRFRGQPANLRLLFRRYEVLSSGRGRRMGSSLPPRCRCQQLQKP